jgi:hypothetical protein
VTAESAEAKVPPPQVELRAATYVNHLDGRDDTHD